MQKNNNQTDTNLAEIYNRIGELNIEKGNNEIAEFFLGKAQEIYEKKEDKYNLAIIYRKLGWCHHKKEISKALDFYKKSISLFDCLYDVLEKNNETTICKECFNAEYAISCIYLFKTLEITSTNSSHNLIEKYKDRACMLIEKLPVSLRKKINLTFGLQGNV